jgi:hypothetical protein
VEDRDVVATKPTPFVPVEALFKVTVLNYGLRSGPFKSTAFPHFSPAVMATPPCGS